MRLADWPWRLPQRSLLAVAADHTAGRTDGIHSGGAGGRGLTRGPHGRPRVLREPEGRRDREEPRRQLEFGSEMFTIAAVPAGEVTSVRAGTGHYHLGTDTDCLPAGTVIPKANPWVHFGDGKNVIEMQLTPGPPQAVGAGRRRQAPDDDWSVRDD